jgi:hypothetical protein
MSFRQLLDIYREAALDRQAEQSTPPTACPNDGEPLKTGLRGELYCPFDGWRPEMDPNWH